MDESKYLFKTGETYNLRGGGTAEILKADVNLKNSGRIILGLIKYPNGEQKICGWYLDGRASEKWTSNLDLLPPEPERVSRWMNVYPSNTDSLCRQYDSRDFADMCASENRTHVLELIYNEDGVFVDVIKHKVGE